MARSKPAENRIGPPTTLHMSRDEFGCREEGNHVIDMGKTASNTHTWQLLAPRRGTHIMPQNNHVKGTALREHVRGNTLPRLQTHAAAWEHHVFFIGAVPPSLRCRMSLDHLYYSSRRRGYASQKEKHFSKSGDGHAARHQRGRGDGMEVKAWAQVAISPTMVHPSCTVAHHAQEAKTGAQKWLAKGRHTHWRPRKQL